MFLHTHTHVRHKVTARVFPKGDPGDTTSIPMHGGQSSSKEDGDRDGDGWIKVNRSEKFLFREIPRNMHKGSFNIPF